MEKHQILIIWNFLLIFATSFAAKNTSETNICPKLLPSDDILDGMVGMVYPLFYALQYVFHQII